MTAADHLNLAGIVLTGAGSTIGMVGVYYQMNGYFAFRTRDFVQQIFRILRKWVSEGSAAARNQLNVSARLAEARGEDRGKSLIGFYCVLLGFTLQMIGSVFLFAALFSNGGPAAGHVG